MQLFLSQSWGAHRAALGFVPDLSWTLSFLVTLESPHLSQGSACSQCEARRFFVCVFLKLFK